LNWLLFGLFVVLAGVLVGVILTCFPGVMCGVGSMTVRDMSMVAGLFVVASFMMIGGDIMMRGRMLVVFGGFAVVLDSLFRHRTSFRDQRKISFGRIAFGHHKQITPR
jgi:hypothetical protein